MASTDSLLLIIAATVGSLGPTLAGLAAFLGTRKNADKTDVVELTGKVSDLHDCFDRHTKTDEVNFRKIDKRLDDADADRQVFHTVLGGIRESLDAQDAEAVRVAEALAQLAVDTATELAEHDQRPEGYRTTPDAED